MFQGSLQLVPQHRAARVILMWPAPMKLYVGQQSKVAVSGTEVCVHPKNLRCTNVTVMDWIIHGEICSYGTTCIVANDGWWRRFCSHRHSREESCLHYRCDAACVRKFELSMLPSRHRNMYENINVRKSLTVNTRSSLKPFSTKHNAL